MHWLKHWQEWIRLNQLWLWSYDVCGGWDESSRVICADRVGSLELLMRSQFQCWVLTPWPCSRSSAITNILSAKISCLTCGYLSNSRLGSLTSINSLLYVTCGVMSRQDLWRMHSRLMFYNDNGKGEEASLSLPSASSPLCGLLDE